MIYANNRGEYEGDWVNDQRHGHGKMTYQDGDVYNGTWKNDKRHGLGEMDFSSDKMIYKGEFIDDSLEGKGLLYHREGTTLYEGLWRNNQPWSEEQSLRQESIDFDNYDTQKPIDNSELTDAPIEFALEQNFENKNVERFDSDDKIIEDSDEEAEYYQSDDNESDKEGGTLSDVEED